MKLSSALGHACHIRTLRDTCVSPSVLVQCGPGSGAALG